MEGESLAIIDAQDLILRGKKSQIRMYQDDLLTNAQPSDKKLQLT